MDQIKIYKYAIIALLILNVAILTFFISMKPKPPRHALAAGFKAEAIELLDLNKEQASKFEGMAKAHNQKLTSIKEQQEEIIRPYIKKIADASVQMDEAQILSNYQDLEREKLEITRLHLEEVKNLLNESQLPQFKTFVERFSDLVLSTGKNGSPPPRKRN